MARSRNRKQIIRCKYTPEDVRQALKDIENGMTVYRASKTYKIPKTTLLYKNIGKISVDRRRGPNTELSKEEEETICKWAIQVAACGFPATKSQLLGSVQLYLNLQMRTTKFKANLPGKKWFANFVKRHPNLTLRVPQQLTVSRARVTEKNIRDWHAEVYDYLKQNNWLNILKAPERIFNMDETAIYLNPKGEKVIVAKSDKAAYAVAANDEKECLTVLFSGSAAGVIVPPMIIYQYKKSIPTKIVKNTPSDWGLGISETGWMTGRTFYEYISNIFYKWLQVQKIKLPVILYVDGHKSHLTMPLSQFCNSNQIILVALYPNSTHLIQPLDVAVFRPLKVSWRKQVADWRIAHCGEKMKKEDFAPIFKMAIENANIKEHLQSGFRACGLFPYNADDISYYRTIRSQVQPMPENNSPGPQCSRKQNILVDNPLACKVRLANENHLRHLEFLMEEDLKDQFAMTEGAWKGDIKYLALFEIWRKMKENDEHELNPIPELKIVEEILGEEIDIVMELPMVNNILGLNEQYNDENNRITDPTVSETINLEDIQTTDKSCTNADAAFKTSFFWPKDNEKENHRPQKEKLPAVASSEAWMSYQTCKITKKELEEKKKAERKEQRLKKACQIKKRPLKESNKLKHN